MFLEAQNMSSSYSFSVNTQWSSGGHGVVEADPGVASVEFSAPPEFQGEAGYWTPERFFVAAIGSCFVTTFRAIAGLSKFQPVALEVSVQGTVEKGEGGYSFSHVTLKPRLTVENEEEAGRGLRLLQKTERACLVSRSLKSVVSMEPTVELVSVSVG